MKNILTLALLSAAAVVPASAQLITPSPITVVGQTWGVTADFSLSFNTVGDTLTVGINNTINGAGNAHGTIKGFALDLPGFDAGTNFDASNVSITSVLYSGDVNDHASEWTIFGTASQDLTVNGLHFNFDLGVGTGNSNINGGGSGGIDFGKNATLVLKFTTPDITSAFVTSVQNYYNTHQGAFLAARWQEVVGTNVTGGSDAGFDTPPGGNGGGFGTVPEPSTYGVFAVAAALGLLAMRRRS